MSEETQVVETTNSNEELDLETTLDGNEDAEALKAQLEDARKKLEQFGNVVARAKKAEAELKAIKEPKETKAEPQTGFSQQDLEVTILKSQGMDDEALAYLKKVATVNGTSLIDAKKDDLFKAFVEKQEAEEKAKKASLGASRGSGKKEPVKTTGLSRDEHRERWEKQTGLNA